MRIIAGERLFAEGVMAGEEGGEGFRLSVALIGFCGTGGVLFLCEGARFSERTARFQRAVAVQRGGRFARHLRKSGAR